MGRAGRLSCTPVWHLCVIVHVFGYVASTHIPVWTNGFWKLWVGPLPVHMHVMVHDTPVSWCVLHICMSVSNVAGPCGCLPVFQQVGSVWVCHGTGYTAVVLPVGGPCLCA